MGRLQRRSGVGGAKVKTSPGGEAFYGEWGSLRYSSGAAMIALVLADSGRLDATRNTQLHSFAVKQINYILGSNPTKTSYMVGFGSKYIKRPHHRTAHGSGATTTPSRSENRHILYGALVGGPPAADDVYGAEDRNAYQKSEVALDYNAGMTSALARLVKEFGGTPLANFPPAETKDDEIYMTASLNQAGSDFVVSRPSGTTTPPGRRGSPRTSSFRYYFTLDSGQAACWHQANHRLRAVRQPDRPHQARRERLLRDDRLQGPGSRPGRPERVAAGEPVPDHVPRLARLHQGLVVHWRLQEPEQPGDGQEHSRVRLRKAGMGQ